MKKSNQPEQQPNELTAWQITKIRIKTIGLVAFDALLAILVRAAAVVIVAAVAMVTLVLIAVVGIQAGVSYLRDVADRMITEHTI
jgi:hypothetical protein